MDAAKLSCIGSPLSSFQPPPRNSSSSSSSSRGTISRHRVLCALKPSSSPSPISNLSREPNQRRALPLAGVLANLLCFPVSAVEEAIESTVSSLPSSPAAEEASSQVLDSAGASSLQSSVEGAVKSSVDGAKAAASGGDKDLVINILGTAAFVGLAFLTIAIVYLSVTDFLEKRKRDEETKKLNEEAVSAKKKQSGSLTMVGREGAKGFGKKRPEEE